MLTSVFLQTTDPLRRTALVDMLPGILASILFHLIVYTAFCNVASFIFSGRCLSQTVNMRLVLTLLIVLSVGFAARMAHVQEIYRTYNYDLDLTRNHLDHLYITWFFIS
jgi:hypothetical protein